MSIAAVCIALRFSLVTAAELADTALAGTSYQWSEYQVGRCARS